MPPTLACFSLGSPLGTVVQVDRVPSTSTGSCSSFPHLELVKMAEVLNRSACALFITFWYLGQLPPGSAFSVDPRLKPGDLLARLSLL